MSCATSTKGHTVSDIESCLVTVKVDGKPLGHIKVSHGEGAERIQIAASAYLALRGNVAFVVRNKAFTIEDIKEWLA